MYLEADGLDARWNGQIIGQGGPPNSQFVSLWTQLATKYASSDKVIFGLMNEVSHGLIRVTFRPNETQPHDVPDIDKWANTVQEVVTAIRGVAKTNMIALPGNEFVLSLLVVWTRLTRRSWTSAQAMPTKSGPALLKVKNPDGTTDGLLIDVHSVSFPVFTNTDRETLTMTSW